MKLIETTSSIFSISITLFLSFSTLSAGVGLNENEKNI